MERWKTRAYGEPTVEHRAGTKSFQKHMAPLHAHDSVCDGAVVPKISYHPAYLGDVTYSSTLTVEKNFQCSSDVRSKDFGLHVFWICWISRARTFIYRMTCSMTVSTSVEPSPPCHRTSQRQPRDLNITLDSVKWVFAVLSTRVSDFCLRKAGEGNERTLILDIVPSWVQSPVEFSCDAARYE